ncbi:unnamed protein product [Taenia asiatica]|uniref:Ku domain-containing protein n=1 Tax=Taenia asiatica TaxID=60517 RepID=A0A0R3W015_TAEAS|nr:unnamed protein product [Taenia asiatica]
MVMLAYAEEGGKHVETYAVILPYHAEKRAPIHCPRFLIDRPEIFELPDLPVSRVVDPSKNSMLADSKLQLMIGSARERTTSEEPPRCRSV